MRVASKRIAFLQWKGKLTENRFKNPRIEEPIPLQRILKPEVTPKLVGTHISRKEKTNKTESWKSKKSLLTDQMENYNFLPELANG